jgi:vitamin B12 transporter
MRWLVCRQARHGRRAALLLLACAAPAATARAQAGRDTVRLAEIVVTATRLPTPIDAVPASVTVLDGAALREQGITHVLEALRAVPSLAVVQTGSFGGVASLFLRGGESDHVRVLVDGVPLNLPGGFLNLADLSTDNVERIEIVRGPTSVLYGSDAMAGVVHVITRRGTGPARARGGVRAGSFGTTVAEAELHGARSGLGYAVAASRFASDGAYAFNNAYRNWTAGAQLRSGAPGREVALALRHHDSEYHFPTDFVGVPVDSNQFGTTRRSLVSVDALQALGRAIEGRLVLTGQWTDDRGENPPGGSPGSSRRRAELRRYGADASVNVRWHPRAILTVGLAAERQHERSWSISQSSFGTFADTVRGRRANRAGYVQVVAAPRAGLAFTGGARVDDHDRFGRFATVRAGVSYAPSRGLPRVRASAGTAFKEPTFCETDGGCFARGNPGLDPERSRSWEVGLEQALLGGAVTVAGTYFDQHIRDLIQYTFLTASPADPNFYNVPGADASGVELEAHATPHRGVTLGAGYTYLRTVARDSALDRVQFAAGARLVRRPTHTASFTAGYRAGRGGGGLRVLYVGERDDLDYRNLDPLTFEPTRVTMPEYWRVDLHGDAVLLRRADAPLLVATARVENVFDRRYEEVLYYPARGRTLLIGARLTTP